MKKNYYYLCHKDPKVSKNIKKKDFSQGFNELILIVLKVK